MANADHNEGREANQHSDTEPQESSEKPEVNSQTRENQQTWKQISVNRIKAANKAALAAIGAGIIGVITTSVMTLPRFIAPVFSPPLSPLEITGFPYPDNSITDNACGLTGVFVVPGTIHPPPAVRPLPTISTGNLYDIVRRAVNAESTSGMYTLQAAVGKTVVITGMHTVVFKRIPAPRSTVFDIQSGCAGAPPWTYSVSVDLDAKNVTPKIQLFNPMGNKISTVHGLQNIVTNGMPIIINFNAYTTRYDVIWKLRIDYTVDGQPQTAWIQRDSNPFHTIAMRNDDTGIYAQLNESSISQNSSPQGDPGQGTWSIVRISPSSIPHSP